MACEAESNSAEEADEEEYQQQESPSDVAPSHHPSAPPDELFDISTTVDPSYVISLIRKLIPTGSGGNECGVRGVDASDSCGKESNGDHVEQLVVSKSFENGTEKMHVIDDFKKSDGDSEDSM